jgi:hypothetical protein
MILLLHIYGLSTLACYDSKLTSETINLVRLLGGTPWTVDQPVARPLYTQESTSHIMPQAGFEPTSGPSHTCHRDRQNYITKKKKLILLRSALKFSLLDVMSS